ncbi:MAG: aliphatic sulfonates ABC transporter substrate-binding protein, partial [Rhodoferax sp.]
AETSQHARVLVNGRGLWTGLSYLAATDSALRDKRAVLKDFKERIVRAQVWASQHPAEFSESLAKIIGIPPEAARLQFERRATRWQDIDAHVLADQQKTADFYLKVGLVKQRLDVRNTFNTSFNTKA